MASNKIMITILLILFCGNCFLVHSFDRAASRLAMNLVAPSSESSSVNKLQGTLPRDVKEAVSICRSSVQEALKQRISRMDIEFPVGTDFGIEAKGKSKKNNSSDGVTRQMLDRSDRELCRIFVEMFQPLGGEHIAAVFTDEALADEAKRKWAGESSARCRLLSMGRQRQKKEKKKLGFAAKLNVELENTSNSGGLFQLPDNCEVALFVSPGPKEFVIIEKICSKVGMGTLVVLLNARLGNVEKFASASAAILFQSEFRCVFNLAAAPQDVAQNCLLYHSFSNTDWILARKPNAGPPKVIAAQPERFTVEDCRREYDNAELEKVEGGVEGFISNVVSWFK